MTVTCRRRDQKIPKTLKFVLKKNKNIESIYLNKYTLSISLGSMMQVK